MSIRNEKLRSVFHNGTAAAAGSNRRRMFLQRAPARVEEDRLRLLPSSSADDEPDENKEIKILMEDPPPPTTTFKHQFAAGAAFVAAMLFITHIIYVNAKEKLLFKVQLYVFFSTFVDCENHDSCRMLSNRKPVLKIDVPVLFYFYLFFMGFVPLILMSIMKDAERSRHNLNVGTLSCAGLLLNLLRGQNNLLYLGAMFGLTVVTFVLSHREERRVQRATLAVLNAAILVAYLMPDAFATMLPLVVRLQTAAFCVLFIVEAGISFQFLSINSIVSSSIHICFSLVTTVSLWELSYRA